MKIKFHTSFIVLILIIASVALFLLSAFAISSLPTKAKSYVTDSFQSNLINLGIENAPESQAKLKEKFNKFVFEENDGKRVVLFSDSQTEALLKVREEGSRIPLSYNEILFLINDTVSMYFKYDEIILKSEIAEKAGINNYLTEYNGIISTADRELDYRKTVTDIYSIFIYRLYLHDSGLVCMTTGSLWNPDTQSASFVYAFEGDDIIESENFFIGKQIYLLSVSGSNEISEGYNDTLYDDYNAYANETIALPSKPNFDFESNVLSYPLLVIDLPTRENEKYVDNFQIDIIQKDAITKNTLFPTNEVLQLKPEDYFDKIYSSDIENITISFGFPNMNSSKVLNDNEKDNFANILNNTNWKAGIHIDENIICRFTTSDGTGINYCCGKLFDTRHGNYLVLSNEEKAVIDSIIKNYNN